ncbi:MAG: LCP family protein [Actinobacteria bacterium]|nr:LCP family protein [Actinomycetota bacterium]
MAAPRLPPRRPRRTAGERAVVGLGILLTLAAVAAATAAGYGAWSFGRVNKVKLRLSAAPPGLPRNFLVVGSDSRAGLDSASPNAGAFVRGNIVGSRSDTIFVVRVDPRSRSIRLLSLPRDLWVPIAGGRGVGRINSALNSGVQTLIDTIQQDFGVPISHYVEVDFAGFQRVVDAIGGVPVWFDRAMRDRNSGLDVDRPGCVTLDGTAALAFARSRYLQYMEDGRWRSDGTADLGRISRQQLLIRRSIDRAVSRGLTNPVTMKRLVDSAVKQVTIDKDLSLSALLDLGRRFSRFRGRQLESFTLPNRPLLTDGGAKVVTVNANAARPVLDLFRDRKLGVLGDVLSEDDVAVQVLNGSGQAGQAADVAGALSSAGFRIDGTGNLNDVPGVDPAPYTRVRFNPQDLGAAALVARHLSAGAVLVPDADVQPGAVELLTAADLTGVEQAALPAILRPAAAPLTTTTTSSAHGGSTSPPTTTRPGSAPPTTEVVGVVPGDAPPGQSCG